MGFDTKVSTIFLRYRGRVIRHLEKQQGINLEFHFQDEQTGSEFDVRDIPTRICPDAGEKSTESDTRKIAIQRAIDTGWLCFATD